MATALDPAYRRVSVEEFLDMDFGGAKAELEDGIIYMVPDGSEVHARIAANIIAYLGPRLRGSGCRPYGSDMAARTGDRSVRFPDVSVYCDNPATRDNATRKLLGDPRIVFEVLSPSTSSLDQTTKLAEYLALPGVAQTVLVDPQLERIRVVTRDDPTDDWLPAGADLPLFPLDLTIPHSEIFSRD